MATVALRATGLTPRYAKLIQSIHKSLCRATPSQTNRFLTTTETGAILERPSQTRFGLIKVAMVVTPFLLGGATISREFAAWLEEHELFVPDDDDD